MCKRQTPNGSLNMSSPSFFIYVCEFVVKESVESQEYVKPHVEYVECTGPLDVGGSLHSIVRTTRD